MTDTRTTRRGRTGRRGFSLAELMIAIGIMGIGLTMAASLFPAAIREHSRSASNVLGMIMTENGLETARATLTYPLEDSGGVTVGTSMADCTKTITPAGCLQYPIVEGDTTAKRGCLIMGRRKTANQNDYILLIIGYVLSDENHTGELMQVTAPVTKNTKNFDISATIANPNDWVKIIGSPVIAPNGSFSKIVGIDAVNSKAVMSHALDKDNDVTNPWIVVEKSSGALAGTRSPAMGVTSTRTALKLASSDTEE